jgi:hypothetical protein
MTTPMEAQLMNRDRYTGKLFLLGMASGRIFVAENWSEISFATVSPPIADIIGKSDE